MVVMLDFRSGGRRFDAHHAGTAVVPLGKEPYSHCSRLLSRRLYNSSAVESTC